MTHQDFRVIHSTLIEHYQFIEFNLEGIYGIISNKDFVSALEDVETSNIKKIILQIKKIEAQNNTTIVSAELYDRIEKICIRRNFWCHNCYIDIAFKRNGDIKKEKDVKTLMSDLREAEDIRNNLFQLKLSLKKSIAP